MIEKFLINTNSWCKILNRTGNETDKKTTFANPRITDQQDLE